jgi:hypothetical protein
VGSGTCDGWVRVVPGDPAASFLSHKVVAEMPECGARMPPGPEGLRASEIACIDGWIESLDDEGCETCGGDICVDLQTDALHCGACDAACPAGAPCVSGVCDCGEDGTACGDTCANLNTDPANCGSCGMACADGEFCLDGVCGNDCGALTQCDQSCVDLQTDAQHCGECDNACTTGQSCTAGVCQCGQAPISFSAHVEPLLDSSCTSMGCHGSIAPKEGLDLRAGESYMHLVSVEANQCNSGLLVAPGSVAEIAT